MADPTNAWHKVFTAGSTEMQNKLKKVHANNPAFQRWLKSSGHGSGKSVKQASKVVVDKAKLKKAKELQGKLYGATTGTPVGEMGGEKAQAERDTVVPLSPEQHSKVQAAKKAAEQAAKKAAETKIKKPKKVAKKAPAAPAPVAKKPMSPAERIAAIAKAARKAQSKHDVAIPDPDDRDHDDFRDMHYMFHVPDAKVQYEEREPRNEREANKAMETPDKTKRLKELAAIAARAKKKLPMKKEEVEQIDEAKNEIGYIKHNPEGGKHGYGTYHGKYLGHSFAVATKYSDTQGNTSARRVAAQNPHLKQHAADIAKHIRSYETRSYKALPLYPATTEKISRRYSIRNEEVEQIDEESMKILDPKTKKIIGRVYRDKSKYTGRECWVSHHKRTKASWEHPSKKDAIDRVHTVELAIKVNNMKEEAEQVDEGKIIKNIKRGWAGWEKGTLADIKNAIKKYPDSTLVDLTRGDTPARRGTPRDVQNRLIARELKKRNQAKMNEQDETMEKVEMAQTQLHFISYAAEEILEYIEKGGEVEEWYQNKLSKVHSDMESLHSYVEGEKRRTGMVAEGSKQEWEVSFEHGPHQSDSVKVKAGSKEKAISKAKIEAEKSFRTKSLSLNWAKLVKQGVTEGWVKAQNKKDKRRLLVKGSATQVPYYGNRELTAAAAVKMSRAKLKRAKTSGAEALSLALPEEKKHLRPGWMMKQDPKLAEIARRLKDKKAAERKLASAKVTKEEAEKPKSDDTPFAGPYSQRKNSSRSRVRKLARRAMDAAIEAKKKKVNEALSKVVNKRVKRLVNLDPKMEGDQAKPSMFDNNSQALKAAQSVVQKEDVNPELVGAAIALGHAGGVVIKNAIDRKVSKYIKNKYPDPQHPGPKPVPRWRIDRKRGSNRGTDSSRFDNIRINTKRIVNPEKHAKDVAAHRIKKAVYQRDLDNAEMSRDKEQKTYDKYGIVGLGIKALKDKLQKRSK